MLNSDGGRPAETILQFGTGVFLLGFADWIVQQLNEQAAFDGGIVAFKARPGSSASLEPLNRHHGEFHIALKGFAGGELIDRVDTITCLRRAINPFEDYAAAGAIAGSESLQWVISNTTEAGIVYREMPAPDQQVPGTFPAMLAALLYERFCRFGGAAGSGLAILCCELIENNASVLRDIVRRHALDWLLPETFIAWLDRENAFCNTLVDRIVTGVATQIPVNSGLGEDALLIEAEAFHSWVIQAPEWVRARLPLAGTDLQVEFVDDLRPARTRKVRVLNGAHTATFALSLMAGVSSVYRSMQTDYLRGFLEQVLYTEVAPTLEGDPAANRQYIDAILQRFDNPFIEHRWQDIALNALSKWHTRLLPTLVDSRARSGEYPPLITLSLAALLLFCRGEWQEEALPLRDDASALAKIANAFASGGKEVGAVEAIFADATIWGEAFPDLPGLAGLVAGEMHKLREMGVAALLAERTVAG